MRRKYLFPMVLAAFVLLGSVAIASTASAPRKGDVLGGANDHREELEKVPKTKVADEVMVVGVWRNCRFHLVRLNAVRETATLPDGQPAEGVRVAGSTKDEMAAQLPERDPKCDNVEPSPEQIAANQAAIDAETARLNPGRRVAPGGPRGS